MANSYGTNPIVLDTFTGALNLCSLCGFATGTPFKVQTIEWSQPSTVNHTAIITDDNGVPIFSETCFVQYQNVEKSFGGEWINNIKVASGAIQSGKITILLSMGPS
jgi:hypothetical protein